MRTKPRSFALFVLAFQDMLEEKFNDRKVPTVEVTVTLTKF